jgi:hypothetical protein
MVQGLRLSVASKSTNGRKKAAGRICSSLFLRAARLMIAHLRLIAGLALLALHPTQARGNVGDLGKYMLEKGAYGKFLNVSAEVNQLLPKQHQLSDAMDLPHIVVVGMESVGKSSTLERIVGFPIFPRVRLLIPCIFTTERFGVQGSGLCTRMPIELTTVLDPKFETPTVRAVLFGQSGAL